jgi:hypothetical protein
MLEVQAMNKKEAIAYAQVTLNHMQSSKYDNEITEETFGIEMKQTFKLYPRNLIISIADAQIKSAQKLRAMKNGSDSIE